MYKNINFKQSAEMFVSDLNTVPSGLPEQVDADAETCIQNVIKIINYFWVRLSLLKNKKNNNQPKRHLFLCYWVRLIEWSCHRQYYSETQTRAAVYNKTTPPLTDQQSVLI